MTPLACALMFLIQTGPIATIGRALAKGSASEKIAALADAKRLSSESMPIAGRIYELVLARDDKLAGQAADCLKTVCPEIHDAALRVRVDRTIERELDAIISLGRKGIPLAFRVHGHLAKNLEKRLADQSYLVESKGFRALQSMDDLSERHWQLAKKYAIDHLGGEVHASLRYFINKDPAKKHEHIRSLIAKSQWTIDEIRMIGSGGTEAAAAIPRLKKLALLDPNASIRQAADAAIELIEATKP